MINEIVEKFKDIVIQACERYGKELFVKPSEIQIRFSIDQGGDLALSITKQHVVVRRETLARIAGIPHLGGVPMPVSMNAIIMSAAPPFIKDSLARLCEERSIEMRRIFVFAGVLEDAHDKLRLVLYNDKNYVADISLEQLVAGNMAEE